MLVLVVTSPGPNQKPAIVFKHLNDLANLHLVRIGAPPSEVNPRQPRGYLRVTQPQAPFERVNAITRFRACPTRRSAW